MDKEERMRKLAELRAQREAKQKETAALIQNPLPAPSSAVASEATSPSVSSVRSSAPAAAAADGVGGAASPPRFYDGTSRQLVADHAQVLFQMERNIHPVQVLPEVPEPVQTYDHAVETDYVYIYTEPCQHPDEVMSKADVDLLLQDRLSKRSLDDSSKDELSGSFGGSLVMLGTTARTSTIAAAGSTRPLWDKCATSSAKKLVHSPNFLSFFARAVSTTTDVLRRGGSLTSDSLSKSLTGEHEGDAAAERAVARLVRRGRYYDDRTSHDAVVTALAFQPHSSDVFAAAVVSGGSSQPVESEIRTVVLLWYARKQGEPLRFVSDSTGPARSLTWSRYHEHLLLAGTDRGRVVLWNTCTQGHPVVTSFPAPDSHNHAIVRVCVQGDGNTNALVSVGCDGKVCTWPVDKPRRPTNVRESLFSEGGAPGCFASAAALCDETQEDGTLTIAARVAFGGHDGNAFSAVSKNARVLDLRRRPSDSRHEAMVTAIDAHPAHADRRIQNLVLTSSLDRSCRVWLGTENSSSSSIVIEGFADHVYDAKWSPTAPSVFACCDGSGTVYLFNLLVSTSKPTARVSLQQGSSSAGTSSAGAGTDGASDQLLLGGISAGAASRAVSVLTLQWDDSGQHVLCGTSSGEVYMLDAVLPPVANDVTARQLSDWVTSTFTGAA